MSISDKGSKQSRKNLATVGIGRVALEVLGTFTNSIQTKDLDLTYDVFLGRVAG